MDSLRNVKLPDRLLFDWFGNLFVESIETVAGTPLTQMPPRERKLDYYKQEFLKAFASVFESIATLSEGVTIVGNNRPNTVSAMSATETLVRACLENYALFHFIYLDDPNPAIVYFRFWSWYREGLIYRQSYEPRGQEDTKKLADDAAEIKYIRDTLFSNPGYTALTPKQQRQYDRKGDWQWLTSGACISKAELISRCGFSRFAFTFYTHLCGFSHTSSMSLLQTSQADFQTSQKLASITMRALFMTAGFYLRSYAKLFPIVEAKRKDQDQRFIADWCEVGETFSAQY